MPMFNSAEFMGQAIDSVLAQSMTDWELILVDDASSDGSGNIARQYARADGRISFYSHDVNQGAAAARNTALGNAKGRYISYLDSDDYWHPDKLEKQLEFSRQNHYAVTITSYSTVEVDGSYRNSIKVPPRTNRHQFLVRPPTCTHTIMVDTDLVGRELLIMPALERRQDAATWLQLLKAGHDIYGMPDILAFNRKRAGSLSSNRIAAVRGTWYLYSKVERLPLPYAVYCTSFQMLNALRKRSKSN